MIPRLWTNSAIQVAVQDIMTTSLDCTDSDNVVESCLRDASENLKTGGLSKLVARLIVSDGNAAPPPFTLSQLISSASWRCGDQIIFDVFLKLITRIVSVSSTRSLSLLVPQLVALLSHEQLPKPITKSTDQIETHHKPTTYRDFIDESDRRVRKTLVDLTRLVPSSRLLMESIRMYFPYHQSSHALHLTYISNLLALSHELCVHRHAILDLLIERLLLLDIEMQRGAIAEENEDDGSDSVDEDCKSSDEEQDNIGLTIKFEESTSVKRRRLLVASSSDAVSFKQVVTAEDQQKEFELMKMEHRQLDGMLTLDDFLCILSEDLSSSLTNKLLDVFSEKIVPSTASRFAQLLLLKLCKQSHQYADQVLGMLFEPLLVAIGSTGGISTESSGLYKLDALATLRLVRSAQFIAAIVIELQHQLPQSLLHLAIHLMARLSLCLRSLAVRAARPGRPSTITICALQCVLEMIVHCQSALSSGKLIVKGDRDMDLLVLAKTLVPDTLHVRYCSVDLCHALRQTTWFDHLDWSDSPITSSTSLASVFPPIPSVMSKSRLLFPSH